MKKIILIFPMILFFLHAEVAEVEKSEVNTTIKIDTETKNTDGSWSRNESMDARDKRDAARLKMEADREERLRKTMESRNKDAG
jgi:hypothetical protein